MPCPQGPCPTAPVPGWRGADPTRFRHRRATSTRIHTMRHQEVVSLANRAQSERVPAMIERYKALIEGGEGKIHRLEDWGRRQLAYPIANLGKAHYLLLNLECGIALLNRLVEGLRFNYAVVVH